MFGRQLIELQQIVVKELDRNIPTANLFQHPHDFVRCIFPVMPGIWHIAVELNFDWLMHRSSFGESLAVPVAGDVRARMPPGRTCAASRRRNSRGVCGTCSMTAM